ncbi:MAG: TonB-dependent receptor [Saprospiraceae bacterium]|nr:TonB-dependent receptor [Saprospiraceae bacterium]
MKSILSLTFCLFLVALASAQTTISGKLTDKKGESIIGASIGITGTYDGTSSDLDGQFSFETTETGEVILQISSLGFESQSLTVTLNDTPIQLEITLKEVINELNAVVITAGAFEASDRKKAVVMKSLDIATTAGATADIAGALNTLPGTQKVGEEGKLFVRGGAAYETQTFIDGLRVQNPYSSSVPNIPARNRFSPFLFKGTVFSTGGYSAEYGQALSAALLLETQDLAKETVTGVSLMSIGVGLSHTQRWDKSSLALSGGYTNMAPYLALVPQNLNWIKPVQGENAQLAYRYKTSETGIFKINLSVAHSAMALEYPDLENMPATSEFDLRNDNLEFNTSFREILGENWSLYAGAAYSDNRDRIHQGYQLDQHEQTAQSKTTLNFRPSENFGLKIGGEYLFNHFEESFTSADQETHSSLLEDHFGATFAEAEISWNRKLAARIGIRHERSSLLDAGNLAPRLSLACKTSEFGQVSLAYGSFYQSPENEWLRYQPKLGYEKSTHLMLNYQIIRDDYIFRVEAYHKKYDALVHFPKSEPWLSQNDGDGYATGLDLYFRDRKTIKNGDYWISYSYLKTEREYLDFPEAAAPRFASPHNLSVVYKHWLPKWTTYLGFTYSFSSPRSYDDPNTVVFNDRQTAAYHDLSFNASYLTQLFGQFTVLYVSASNVLGIEQSFGERFSSTPDSNGEFASIAVRPPAKRFLFVGLFISIGKKPDQSDRQNL